MRRADLAFVALIAFAAAGCPAPRRIYGFVYASGSTTPTGSRALKRPLEGASVTWSCPPGVQGPQPQVLTTDPSGKFKSKDFYSDLPLECDLVVTKAGHLEFRERVEKLCAEPRPYGCRILDVAVELKSMEEVAASAVPLDAPRGNSDIHTVLSIAIAADGTTLVDGKPIADDAALIASAKTAREKNPELRAVINADAAVPHGRVIRVLDLLKQAQVGKIAFGVSPVK